MIKIGTTLHDRYLIEKLLGSGGMGEVFQVLDLQENRKPKAIKHLDANGEECRRRFQREYELLQKVRHPALVQAFDIFETAQGMFMVLELADGDSMGKILRMGERIFTLSEQLLIANKVARGLEVLHLANIMHRDIKPDNIIVHKKTGGVKLVDLGVGKDLSRRSALTQEGIAPGTAAYMSPEQINEQAIGLRSDIFSLGVTLYQFFLWAEGSPFQDISTVSTIMKVLQVEPPKLYEALGSHVKMRAKEVAVYRGLSDLLARAMEKDDQKRDLSCGAIADRCEELYRQLVAQEDPSHSDGGTTLLNLSPRLDSSLKRALQEFHDHGQEHDAKSRPRRRRTKPVPKKMDQGKWKFWAGGMLSGILLVFVIMLIQSAPIVPKRAGESSHVTTERKQNFAVVKLNSAHTNPTPTTSLALAHNHRGIDLAERGDWAGAIFEHSRAIELAPSDICFRLNRANDYYLSENFAKAIEDCSRVISLSPDQADAYHIRAVSRYQLGEIQGAVEDYTQALRLKPDLVEAYRNRGQARSALGDRVGAITDYTQAISFRPNWAEVYHARGGVRRDSGDLSAAMEDFDQAIRLKPNWADPYTNRGNLYYMQGQFPKALEDLNRSIELNPNSSETFVSRGALRALQDLEGAIADFSQALRLNPRNVTAYMNRGLARNMKEDWAGATEDFCQAVRLDPNNISAYKNLSMVYIKKGEVRLAIDTINTLYRLRPEVDTLASLGWCYYLAKDYPKAVAIGQQVLAVSPDSFYSLYNTGLAYLALGDTRQAEHWYQLAMDKDRTRAGLKEAVSDLESLQKEQPERREVQYIHGLLAEHQGDSDKAAAIYRKYVQAAAPGEWKDRAQKRLQKLPRRQK